MHGELSDLESKEAVFPRRLIGDYVALGFNVRNLQVGGCKASRCYCGELKRFLKAVKRPIRVRGHLSCDVPSFLRFLR